MIWINTEDVICIHNRIIEKTKGIEGIRDLHGLEAAIAAPLQTFGYGLAANHAFLDGNKRIGAMMTQLLLKWNSYPLELQSGELADMFIAIADRTSGEEKLLQWIKAHRKTERRNER